jgi:hypothetical protein
MAAEMYAKSMYTDYEIESGELYHRTRSNQLFNTRKRLSAEIETVRGSHGSEASRYRS